jgi:molybdate transport system substrate-binding protein
VRRAPLCGFLAIVACASAACTSVSGGDRLTVFAAASLTGVTDSLAAAWAAEDANVALTFSTGSSAALRVQIEQGAPADVFLSADLANPQQLVDDGLSDGPPQAYASNSLTIIVPAGNPAAITTAADLARPGLCIVAAGTEVPITKYAEQSVARLASLPGYDSSFADGYAANVCSREDNVAAVVAKIALGEGDAAIVYATDARSAGSIEAIGLPDAANVRATYAAVVIGASARATDAHAFVDWLTGPAGQSILDGFGFGPP